MTCYRSVCVRASRTISATDARLNLDGSAIVEPQRCSPDAFEVALLNAATGESLVGTAAGLTETDALNLQVTGEMCFAAGVARFRRSTAAGLRRRPHG